MNLWGCLVILFFVIDEFTAKSVGCISDCMRSQRQDISSKHPCQFWANEMKQSVIEQL